MGGNSCKFLYYCAHHKAMAIFTSIIIQLSFSQVDILVGICCIFTLFLFLSLFIHIVWTQSVNAWVKQSE